MPRTRSNSSANKQKGVAAAACSAPGPDEGQNISSRSRANSNAPPPPLAGPSIPLKLAWRIQGKHVLIAGGGTRMPPILSTLLNSGAHITVVCPQVRILPPSLFELLETDPRVHYIDRDFIKYDLKNVLNSFGPVHMLFSTHDDMGKAILTVDTAKQRNVPVHSSHFPELCDFDLEENVVEKADKSNDLRSSTATRIVEKVKSLMEEQQKTVAFEAASIALKQQRNQPSAQVASTSSTTSANINTVRFSPAENRVFLNAVQGIHKRADSAGKQATANSLSNSPSSSPSSSSSATTLSIIAAPHRPFTSNTQAIASTSIYGYLTESVTSWSRSTAESYIKSVKDNVNHYTGLVVGKEGATHPSLTTTAVSLAIAPVAITAATASTSYNLASQAAQTTSTAIKSTASLGVETATSIASSATQRATHIVEKATAHAQFSISSAKNTVSSSTLAASTAVKGFTESSLNYSLSLLPVSIDATVRGTLQTIPFVSSLDLQQSARRGKLSILEFEDGVFSCDLNNNSLISAVRNSHVVVCDSNAPVAIVKKIKSSIGYLSQTQLKFVESNHPSSSELAAVNKTSELVANYLRQGFTVLRIRCSSSNHESTQISKIMGFNGEEKITIFDIRPPPALPSKVTPTSLGPPPGYYRGRRQSIAYEAPARNSDPARLDF